MKKLAVSVGQEVWVKPLGNAARRLSEAIPGIVERVGTKFFTVRFRYVLGGVRKFHLSNGLENSKYTADWQVFVDKQVIDDEREAGVLMTQIRTRIGYGTALSLPTLRAIDEILKAEDAKKS